MLPVLCCILTTASLVHIFCVIVELSAELSSELSSELSVVRIQQLACSRMRNELHPSPNLLITLIWSRAAGRKFKVCCCVRARNTQINPEINLSLTHFNICPKLTCFVSLTSSVFIT